MKNQSFRTFSIWARGILGVAFVVAIALCVFRSNSVSAAADIPQYFNYQGRLMSSSGVNVVDGTYSIKFSLYSQSSGGTPIWTASGTTAVPVALNMTVTNGLFTVLLGDTSFQSQNALANIDWNQDGLYLGITVGADSEMTPRKKLSSVPFAFNSNTLQGNYASSSVPTYGGSLFSIHQTAANAATSSRAALSVTTEGTDNNFDFLIKAANSSGDVFTVSRQGNATTTGNLVVLTNTTLGDAVTDLLTINARVVSDINPNSDLTYKLGDATHRWLSLEVGTATTTNLFATTVSSTNGIFQNATSSWFGATTVSTTNLFVNGQAFSTGAPATTATLQTITANGATTTDQIYAFGGIQTSSLTATGTTSLQGTTLTFATATEVTSTNIFASFGTFTTLASNVLTASQATATTLAFTSASGSSLLVSGQSVCLANGTNCPAGASVWTDDPTNGTIYNTTSTRDVLIGGNTTATAGFIFDKGTTTSTVIIGNQTGNANLLVGTTTYGGGLDPNFVTDGNDVFVQGQLGSLGGLFSATGVTVGTGSTIYSDGNLYKTTSGDFTLALNNAGSNWRFRTGGQESFTVASSGRIGIGVSTPLEALDVSGTIRNVYQSAGQGFSVVGTASLGLSPGPNSIFLKGRYAYTANYDNATVSIVDVTNPASSTVVGTARLNAGVQPYGIYVAGNYAYVANINGRTMNVIDVSNASSPVVISTTTITTGLFGPNNVFVAGNFAYVSNYDEAQMFVLNIADPRKPVIVSTTTLNVLSSPYGITAVGRYVYTANSGNSSVNIIDVSNPSAPVTVGTSTLSSGASPYQLAISGRYAYTANYGNNTVNVIDISNPALPAVVATATLAAGSGPSGISVSGRYVYTSNYTNGTVNIIDVAVPTSPVVVGSSNLGGGSPNSIFVSGRYAYTANYSNHTVSIIDLKGIETPALLAHSAEVGSLSVLSNASIYNQLTVGGGLVVDGGGILSQGSLAISSTNTTSTFVFAVSTTNMEVSSRLTVGGVSVCLVSGANCPAAPSGAYIWTDGTSTGVIYPTTSTRDVLIGGNTTATAGFIFDSSLNGTSTMIVGGATNVNMLVGTTTYGGGLDPNFVLDGNDVFVQGQLGSLGGLFSATGVTVGTGSTVFGDGNLYKTTNGDFTLALNVASTSWRFRTGGQESLTVASSGFVGIGAATPLEALDVNGTIRDLLRGNSNLTVVTTTQTGTEPYSVAVNGRYVYVTDYSSSDLKVYDVSNPSAPQVLSTLALNGGPISIAVKGNYGYVVNDASNTLQIVDISNPSSPFVTASTGTGGSPSSIYVSGNYGYIVNLNSSTLQVFDISNPQQPTLRGSVATNASPIDVEVQGKYAYITMNFANTLQVIDVSNPSNPVVVGTSAVLGNTINQLAVKGRYAYASAYDDFAIKVVDISNPNAPFVAATINTTARPVAVALSGRYLYSTTYGAIPNKLEIFDIQNASSITGVVNYTVGEDVRGIAISGRYVYLTNSGNNTMSIVELDGVDTTALTAQGAELGSLSVLANASIFNQLSVGGGLVVGSGGIFSQGSLAIYSTNTTSTIAFAVSTTYAEISNRLTVGGVSVCLANGTNCQAGAVPAGAYVWTDNPTNNTIYNSTTTRDILFGGSTTDTAGFIFDKGTATSTVIIGNQTGNANLLVGTTTYGGGLDSNFVLNGNDVFVQGQLGSLGGLFSATGVTVGGGSTIYGDGLINKTNGALYIQANAFLPNSDNGINFGSATATWKDAYLSGGIYSYSGVVRSQGFISPNLLQNPSFEAATSGGWSMLTTGTSTAATTTPAYDGSFAGQLHVDNMGDYTTIYQTVGATSGTQYVASLYSKGAVGGETLFILFQNSGSGFYNFSGPNAGTFTPGNPPIASDQMYNCVQTTSYSRCLVPAITATGTSLTMYVYAGNNQIAYANQTIDVDAIQLQVGSSATAYQTTTLPAQNLFSFWSSASSTAVRPQDKIFDIASNSGSSSWFSMDGNGLITQSGTGIQTDEDRSSYALTIPLSTSNTTTHSFSTVMGTSTLFSISGTGNGTGGIASSTISLGLGSTGSIINLRGITYANDGFVTATLTASNLVATGNITNIVPSGTTLTTVTSTAVGTDPQSVYVQGKYAYVGLNGVGGGLQVVDVSSSTMPKVISTANTYSSVTDLFVSGRYAYVKTSGSKTFYIYDISNPSSLTEMSSSTIGDGRGLFVSGKYAYIAGQSSSEVLVADVTNPKNPVTVSTLAVGSNPNSIYVQGKYLYVAELAAQDIRIFDVTDPANPVSVNTISTASQFKSIAVQGRYAYVASQSPSEIKTYDISNPASAVLMSSFGVQSAPASISVSGRYAYVEAGDFGTVSMIDYADPSNPVKVATASVGAQPTKSFLSGRYLYVVSIANDILSIVDVQGTETNGLIAHTAEIGNLTVLNSGVIGGRLTVVDQLTVGTGGILTNGPVSGREFSALPLPGGLSLTSQTSYNGNTSRDLAVSGNYVFSANHASNTVSILDATNPSNITLVTSTYLGDSSTGAYGISVQGHYAYAVNYSSSTLAILDIANPTVPVLVSTTTVSPQPSSIFVSGKYAYITLFNNARLAVMDISNPYAPILSTTTAVGTNPSSVYVEKGYAYVLNATAGTSTLSILNVSDPTNPGAVSALTLNGNNAARVKVVGSYAYIALTNNVMGALSVVNIKNPSSPATVATVRFSGITNNLTVNGRFAYMTDNSRNVRTFDISDPTNPILVDTLDIGASANPGPVTLSGRTLYVADSNNDQLYAFDTQGVETGGLTANTAEIGNLQILANATVANDFTIGSGLNVGNGGIYSQGGLSVYTSMVDATSTLLYNSASNTAPVLQIVAGCDNANSSTNSMLILAGNTTDQRKFRVGCDGTVATDATFNTGGADLAEYFKVSEAGLVPGTAVSLATGATSSIEKSTDANRSRTIGVIASNPGFIGNSVEGRENDTNYVLVALLGQTTANADASAGPIVVGDILMASDNGMVVKAKGAGQVIGTALEALASGTGAIKIMVEPHWWAGDLLTAEGDANFLTGDLTVKALGTATTSSDGYDSSQFSFQGSVYDEAAVTAYPTSFSMWNESISASSSLFHLGFATGTNPKSSVLTISNMGDVSVTGDFTVGRRLFLGSKIGQSGSTSTYIYVDDTLSPSSTYIATNADGWSTSSTYDYAERYYSDDNLVSGELVAIDLHSMEYVKRTTGESDVAIGIISTKPGFVTGGYVKGTYPVALAGRVPTKVVGPIEIGDPIMASDVPGMGKKADKVGFIVGYALEAYPNPDQGIVSVFVQPGWNGMLSSGESGSGSVYPAASTAVRTGLAKIYAGSKEVTVRYQDTGAYPLVQATPYGETRGGYWVKDVKADMFTIEVAEAPMFDLVFAWSVQASTLGNTMSFSDNTQLPYDPTSGVAYGPVLPPPMEETPTSTATTTEPTATPTDQATTTGETAP